MAASLAEVAMESQQDDHPVDVTRAGGYGFGGGRVEPVRGAGNNGPVSTATASSFLNAAGTIGG
jgi:hypothetical protein